MINFVRTDSENADFRRLVGELDADLSIRDGNEHSFYTQYNKIDSIKYVIVVYEQDIAVGCGAFKEYSPDTMEIKRMYVKADKRGQGIASSLLKMLEQWVAELHYSTCILETGLKQPEAIGLYRKNNYKSIPNYGQYINISNSVCFEKKLYQNV